jgi:hypothetical protein
MPGLLVNPGSFTPPPLTSLHTNHAQLLPQIFINYRRHNTEGLQGSMMLLWASAGVPLGVYNIVEELNVALRVQAQILTLLSLVTWAQCLYYGKVGSQTIRVTYMRALTLDRNTRSENALLQSSLYYSSSAASRQD